MIGSFLCQVTINKRKGFDMGKKRKTTLWFIEEAMKVHGTKYSYDESVYETTHVKLIVICSEHGHWKQSPSSHLRGRGCPECKLSNRRLTNSEFISKSKLVHGNKYDYAKTKYINIKSKVIISCPIHGEFVQTASSHMTQGHGCGACNESRGERNIRLYLTSKSIPFEREKKFDNNLRFDFYLPDHNTCIEFDGEQHFYPVRFRNSVSKEQSQLNFNQQQIRDATKTKYCSDHNIGLIRIPYLYRDNISTFFVYNSIMGM
jgi:very-short-patch-repair endonuclease